VTRAISEQEEREADGSGRSQVGEEKVKALGIEGRQFQKETLPREWFDGPVQGETLEAIGGWEERLDAARREPAAQNRQEPTATFVLDPQAPLAIALLVGTGYARVELRPERSLELDTIRGLFCGCERRGALSFAFSLYRTSLCTVL
jgi:hypothetical protein